MFSQEQAPLNIAGPRWGNRAPRRRAGGDAAITPHGIPTCRLPPPPAGARRSSLLTSPGQRIVAGGDLEPSSSEEIMARNHKTTDKEKAPRGGKLHRQFDAAAAYVSRLAGRPSTFLAAVLTVIIWGVTGPLFRYSDTWQLVINTGTTIVTFLMVFLIQNSQNRDSAAIQVKLDELIRVGAARNLFVGIEHLTENEIEELRRKCEERAKAAAPRRNG
jgi:low affinity Fe/Cu permease/antitoxin (DNA-binding transcriptional repressor) of toxin-antitoxin stability system